MRKTEPEAGPTVTEAAGLHKRQFHGLNSESMTHQAGEFAIEGGKITDE